MIVSQVNIVVNKSKKLILQVDKLKKIWYSNYTVCFSSFYDCP